MKGFNTGDGYMGMVDKFGGGIMRQDLFNSLDEFYEFTELLKK